MKEEKKPFFDKINTSKLNSILGVGEKTIKILYLVLVALLVYVAIQVLKDFKVLPFILKILSVISPLFIGFIIAWILNPLVNKLTSWKINKTLSVVIVFLALIGVIYLVMLAVIPALANQIEDIVKTIPNMLSDVKVWVENLFDKLSNLSTADFEPVKVKFFASVEKLGTTLQKNLPNKILGIISGMLSGLGVTLLSLVIGFYMSFNFNNVSKGFIKLFPSKYRDEVTGLLEKLGATARNYVNGTLMLSLILTIITYIGFSIIGVKAALLLAIVCGITNLIPYVGPYMGAAVAALVGFSQSSLIGILTLAFILITQTLEGNFLTPLFMSKKMHLTPITIIVALLIFEHFFGIVGMIIATPVVALLKIIFSFFNDKYKFFEYTK